MAELYTEDATYGWNYGPDTDFMAVGRDEIRDLALGAEMGGLDGWEYPYQEILIDEPAGPGGGLLEAGRRRHARADGTEYEVHGIGGSWFRYAGDSQWSWQRDWFDFGNAARAVHGDDGRRHAVRGHDRAHASLHEAARCPATTPRAPRRWGSGTADASPTEFLHRSGLDVLLIDGKLRRGQRRRPPSTTSTRPPRRCSASPPTPPPPTWTRPSTRPGAPSTTTDWSTDVELPGAVPAPAARGAAGATSRSCGS